MAHMAAQQPRFVRCPSCQWGTLADGYFCAYCGRPLRPGGAPGGGGGGGGVPQAAAPPAGAGGGGYYQQPPSNPQYYQQPATRGNSFMRSSRGGRGPVFCPSWGAPNDRWLTHCKECTRALMTSG